MAKVGDWVRYTDDFCKETSTTTAGLIDVSSRRGRVVLVFTDEKRCLVDWGDCIVQFHMDSPSIVATESPYVKSRD